MTELADDTFFMYPDGTFFMPGHLATTAAATPAASTAAPVPTPADDSDASSDSSDLPALIYLDGDSEVAVGIPVVTATAIGTAVGAFTAALVGTAVGTAAGATAGTADGAAVGAFGHTVGTAVSAVTGAAVATVVGAAVGTAVGTAAATAAATAADSAADAATDTMGGADAHMPDVVFVQGSAIAHNVFSLAQLAHVLNMITPSRSPGPDGLRAADVRTYPPSPPPPSPPPPPPPSPSPSPPPSPTTPPPPSPAPPPPCPDSTQCARGCTDTAYVCRQDCSDDYGSYGSSNENEVEKDCKETCGTEEGQCKVTCNGCGTG